MTQFDFSVPKTCDALKHLGLKTNAMFYIDPDGHNFGTEAFQVDCEGTSGKTIVHNNREKFFDVDHCDSDNCVAAHVIYGDDITTDKLRSLIEASDMCYQRIEVSYISII